MSQISGLPRKYCLVDFNHATPADTLASQAEVHQSDQAA